MSRSLRFVALVAGIALFALSSVLSAEEPAKSKNSARPAAGGASRASGEPAELHCPAVDVPQGALRWAFIDPQTGRLRPPTPEEAAQFAAQIRAARAQALSELEVVVHPNGMKSVDLKDAFLIDLVAHRNPDGSLSMKCLPPGTSSAPLAPVRPAAAHLEEK